MWSCQSLWTAVRYNLPIKFVIIANGSYRLLKVNKVRQMGEKVKGKYLGMGLDSPDIDFCQLAQAIGIQSQRVSRPEDLEKALAESFGTSEPALIEVGVDDTI